MPLFSKLDLIALAWFIIAWLGYAVIIEMTAHGKSGLNAQMHRYRDLWMERMLAREARMVDGQIIAGLQNGTAFFASTSLIALGARRRCCIRPRTCSPSSPRCRSAKR